MAKNSTKTVPDTPNMTPIMKLRSAVPDPAIKAAIIQHIMTNNITRLGGKRFAEIAPEMLDVPTEYQRPADIKRAERIAAKWSDKKYTMPKVTYRNGQLNVLDGNHTRTAAIIAGRPTIAVEIVEDITIQQEAELFDTQDENKVRVNWYNKYKSMLFRGHPDAVALNNICNKYQLTIGPNRSSNKRHMSAIRASLKLIADETFGPDYIDWVLGIMHRSNNWLISGNKGTRDSHINMFTDVYCEGVANGRLTEYADKLAAVLDKHSPDDFDGIALTTYGANDTRYPTKRLCLAIAHDEYVEGAYPHVIRPVD